MRLWLDTEFNGFRGALISMALVDESERYWYQVVGCEDPVPWVRTNVMPVLRKRRTTLDRLSVSLAKWLQPYASIHVMADWPADLMHFCSVLMRGPGRCLIVPPLTLELVETEKPTSLDPHNALEDARALRLGCLALDHTR